jgi:integrase
MPAWVFPSLEGTALEERNVRHVFGRLLEKAELRQMRLHDLRHTFATLLLQANAPITYVSSWAIATRRSRSACMRITCRTRHAPTSIASTGNHLQPPGNQRPLLLIRRRRLNRLE